MPFISKQKKNHFKSIFLFFSIMATAPIRTRQNKKAEKIPTWEMSQLHPLLPTHVLLYDTESTGPSIYHDHIIQIGVILCRCDANWTKIGKFKSYVFTDRHIHPESMAIHHITPEMLIGQPVLSVVAKELWQWMTDLLKKEQDELKLKIEELHVSLSAHGGYTFDFILLWMEMRRHRLDVCLEFEKVRIVSLFDTLQALKKVLPVVDESSEERKKFSFKLGLLHERVCLTKMDGQAHDAMVDVQALHNILKTTKFINVQKYAVPFKHKFIAWLARQQERQEEQEEKAKEKALEKKERQKSKRKSRPTKRKRKSSRESLATSSSTGDAKNKRNKQQKLNHKKFKGRTYRRKKQTKRRQSS
jgi:DNA polymerase III epsilon subunit-like protein